MFGSIATPVPSLTADRGWRPAGFALDMVFGDPHRTILRPVLSGPGPRLGFDSPVFHTPRAFMRSDFVGTNER